MLCRRNDGPQKGPHSNPAPASVFSTWRGAQGTAGVQVADQLAGSPKKLIPEAQVAPRTHEGPSREGGARERQREAAGGGRGAALNRRERDQSPGTRLPWSWKGKEMGFPQNLRKNSPADSLCSPSESRSGSALQTVTRLCCFHPPGFVLLQEPWETYDVPVQNPTWAESLVPGNTGPTPPVAEQSVTGRRGQRQERNIVITLWRQVITDASWGPLSNIS